MVIRISFLLFMVFLGVSCNTSSRCEKYINENYTEESSNLPDSLRLQFEAYLERLKEPKIKNLDFEAYRL